jgi:hypothetical protein
VAGLYRDENVRSDNSVFRRGLVLGLTLAELGILIIFVLLLALGGILAAKERQIRELQQALPEERASERLLTVLAERTGAQPEEVKALTRELVASAVREDENARLRERTRLTENRLRDLEEAVEAALGSPAPSSETPEQRGQRLRQAVSDIVAERQAARQALADVRSGTPGEVRQQVLATRLENERLKGTLAYANRRLAAFGRGTERPACWATPAGAPEYIFDVTLSSAGIAVRDRQLPHRAAQQAQLPVRGISFGRVLSGQAFQAQTRALFDWGEAHDCRFFVQVFDRTGATEKERYKALLRFVEGHFYKFESRG